MREKTIVNNEAALKNGLTMREQEIFNMLLDGAAPKEIVYSLSISFNTFKTHRKNLYYKLGIRTIREFYAKYLGAASFRQAEIVKSAVFARWVINADNLGSYVNITEKIELIDDQYFPTITITGKLSYENHAFSGAHAYPDPPTLEVMKKMKCFSFKVLGDGNVYAVMLPTTETRLKSGNNHYRKSFTARNGEISTITVKIDELAQSPFFGNQVPFKVSNIEFFQIHAHSTVEFNLKIWDVRLYPE